MGGGSRWKIKATFALGGNMGGKMKQASCWPDGEVEGGGQNE